MSDKIVYSLSSIAVYSATAWLVLSFAIPSAQAVPPGEVRLFCLSPVWAAGLLLAGMIGALLLYRRSARKSRSDAPETNPAQSPQNTAEALVLRESTLRTLIESVPECVKLVDADGKLLSMNRAGLKIMGVESAERLIGQCFCGVIAPEHQPLFQAFHERVIHGESAVAEYYLLDVNGGRHWMESHGTPFMLGDRRVVLSVTRDRTEAKRSAEIAQLITRFQTDFIADRDPDELFIDLLMEVLNLTESESGLIGEVFHDSRQQPFLQVYASFGNVPGATDNAALPEHAKLPQFDTLIGQVLATGEPVIANDAATPSGSGGISHAYPLPCGFLGLPIRADSVPVGVLALANRPQGFSEGLIAFLQPLLASCGALIKAIRSKALLRETEARFRVTADSAPVLIWMADAQRHCTWFNQGWLRFTGRGMEQELGEGWTGGVHPDDLERRMATYGSACEGRTPFTMEYRLRRYDGEYRWVLDIGTPRFDEAGYFRGYIGSCVDVTAQKQAEAELVQARDAAEAASRAKSVFLANMSHELRTPLNAILGFAQLMEHDPRMPEDERRNVATINRSGQHLLSLINDVLEISRIETGRTPVAHAAFDLLAALSAVEEMIRLRAEAKGLAFAVERPADLPPHVLGDTHRLRQVLLNLLGNAVKYTDRGRVRLAVTALPGETFRFEVSDTGPGIAREEQERVFQAFYQTQTGIAKGEGTGLGLNISREFVRLMGGELTIASVPGKGAVFGFTLHLPQAGAPAGAAGVRIVGLADGQPAPRILLAEDHPDNRQVVQQFLAWIGCEVCLAADGREAVEAYRSRQPHLILMDMRMPVMDGYEATRAIRALPGGDEVSIVALTASAFEEDRERVLAAGCDEVLSKPVEAERLFEAIGRRLGLRFKFAEIAAPETAPATADLGTLPAGLRQELAEAAVNLDKEAVLIIAERLRAEHPAEAEFIAGQVESYRFDLLEQCGPL